MLPRYIKLFDELRHTGTGFINFVTIIYKHDKEVVSCVKQKLKVQGTR